MPLEVTRHEVFLMGPGTYMGIDVFVFGIDPALEDSRLLADLVDSAGYACSFAEPFDAQAEVVEPAIHGKWWRSSISAERFRASWAVQAERVLRDWADNQDWSDPDFRQPPEAQLRLTQVLQKLACGTVYRLENPGVEAFHEWGWVVGAMGFHEFAVIDRERRELSLVVASDE